MIEFNVGRISLCLSETIVGCVDKVFQVFHKWEVKDCSQVLEQSHLLIQNGV